MPTSDKASSSSFPAGPTKGLPTRSSWSPGCSPTIMITACDAPSPKTVCVAVFQRSQALHVLAAFLSAGIVLRGVARPAAAISPSFGRFFEKRDTDFMELIQNNDRDMLRSSRELYLTRRQE